MIPKKLILFLLLISIINMIVFYFRDYFHYRSYRGYEDLYTKCKVGCYTMWMDIYDQRGNPQIKEAERISSSWFQKENVTPIQKAGFIASHLHEKFKNLNGHPSALFLSQSPLRQYNSLLNNSGDSIWCGIYANMFSLFAWSNGIVTRTIEIQYGSDAHVVNECFLPELKKWILIDPTYGILAFKSKQGVWLDLQVFRNEIRRNRPVYALMNINDSLQYILLNHNADFINRYYKPDTSQDFYYRHTSLKEAYKPAEKIKRYILPVAWYDLYNEKNKTNVLFYIKLFFIFLWMIVSSLLFVELKKKRGKKKNPK